MCEMKEGAHPTLLSSSADLGGYTMYYTMHALQEKCFYSVEQDRLHP